MNDKTSHCIMHMLKIVLAQNLQPINAFPLKKPLCLCQKLAEAQLGEALQQLRLSQSPVKNIQQMSAETIPVGMKSVSNPYMSQGFATSNKFSSFPMHLEGIHSNTTQYGGPPVHLHGKDDSKIVWACNWQGPPVSGAQGVRVFWRMQSSLHTSTTVVHLCPASSSAYSTVSHLLSLLLEQRVIYPVNLLFVLLPFKVRMAFQAFNIIHGSPQNHQHFWFLMKKFHLIPATEAPWMKHALATEHPQLPHALQMATQRWVWGRWAYRL